MEEKKGGGNKQNINGFLDSNQFSYKYLITNNMGERSKIEHEMDFLTKINFATNIK